MTKGTNLWARLMRRYGWRWTGDGWLHKNGRLESRQAAMRYKAVGDTPPPF